MTLDWSTGPVQYLYVNPAGSSIQITLPADPRGAQGDASAPADEPALPA